MGKMQDNGYVSIMPDIAKPRARQRKTKPATPGLPAAASGAVPAPARLPEPRTTGAEPPSVAETIKHLRRQRSLSLEDLAQMSGVSRSMLSQIERDATNPTVATLWRITSALGVSVDEVMGTRSHGVDLEVIPGHTLPVIGNADGLMRLRMLGPMSTAGSQEWYELSAQPGARLESKPHGAGTREHLFVTEGELTVSSGDVHGVVRAGELARYNADVPHVISNHTRNVARAWLTVLSI
jgi:transcriptional regulator with XRE-family HTH domain